jgi:hypothetical protein
MKISICVTQLPPLLLQGNCVFCFASEAARSCFQVIDIKTEINLTGRLIFYKENDLNQSVI